MALPDRLSRTPAGTERVSEAVLKEHQRARVVEAATKVFAERGYHSTTVDDIVSAAKIGVGNFYNLFAGKEGCFLTAYDDVISAARKQISDAAATEDNWPSQVRAGLLAGLEQIEANPPAARLVLVEAQAAGPRARDHHRTNVEELARFFARGRGVSPFADQLPDRLDDAVAGGLLWFLQAKISEGGFKSAKAHLPETLKIVTAPYIGRDSAEELVG
jgi:AcrR family transcriptional regulator